MLAAYLEISAADQSQFRVGHESIDMFAWLESRNRLDSIQEAFNSLGWQDLLEIVGRGA